MKATLCLLLLVITSLFISSCKCNRDEQFSFEADNSFAFNIIDRVTKKNVLLIGYTNYNYDTVALYDINWEKVHLSDIYQSGLITLTFLNSSDKGVINQRISRKYYMYFNHADIDTIDFEFEMQNGECDQVMKYFKVSYNDSTYFDAYTDLVPNYLNFIK